MERDDLYRCMGCSGRSLTMQSCEAVLRSLGELRVVQKADGDLAVAQLPAGFCGDRHARGLPQAEIEVVDDEVPIIGAVPYHYTNQPEWVREAIGKTD